MVCLFSHYCSASCWVCTHHIAVFAVFASSTAHSSAYEEKFSEKKKHNLIIVIPNKSVNKLFLSGVSTP